jgi:hypothetical protein
MGRIAPVGDKSSAPMVDVHALVNGLDCNRLATLCVHLVANVAIAGRVPLFAHLQSEYATAIPGKQKQFP